MPGLPNTKVIHPRFEQHHRPVAAGQMTGTCRIERPSSGETVWDDTAGREIPKPAVLLYDGPCRYQYLTPAGQPVIADQTTPLADVRVTVEVGDVTFADRDLVTVTAAENNPDLVGRTLTVQAVSGSSISFQRDLTCRLRQPSAR